MPVSVLQQHHWMDFGGVSPGMGVCLFVFLQRAWLTLDTGQHSKKTFESSDSFLLNLESTYGGILTSLGAVSCYCYLI